MSQSTVNSLTRVLVALAFLLLLARRAQAAPPEEYVYRLLNPVPTLAPLPMLPVYPAKKPVSKPAPKPVVKPKPAAAKPTAKKVPSRAQQDANGLCAVAWLRVRMWWREVTYNAGPGISEAIKANHGNPRDEYCGHTQAGANRSCGLTVPAGSGGSYNWFLPGSARNVLRGKVGSFDSARIGYKVGIFNKSKGRIAHITAIAEKPILRANRNAPAQGAWCIGGNEGRGTNAGMHRTWYPKANIFALANYNY